MAVRNVITGVYKGEIKTVIITMVDSDGDVVDVSGYDSTKELNLRGPHDRKELTKTLTFTTDGADGKLQFTFASGDLDIAGTWEGQVELNVSGGDTVKSAIITMEVGKEIG